MRNRDTIKCATSFHILFTELDLLGGSTGSSEPTNQVSSDVVVTGCEPRCNYISDTAKNKLSKTENNFIFNFKMVLRFLKIKLQKSMAG